MAVISGSSGTVIANNALNGGISQATNIASEAEFDFFDLLDIVNPLQHVPIVSHLYRAITGDLISPVAQVIGGGVFGGIPGALSSAVQLAAGEIIDNDDTQTALQNTRPSQTAQPHMPTGNVANSNLHQKEYASATITESDYPMTAHAKRMQARMAYWA